MFSILKLLTEDRGLGTGEKELKNKLKLKVKLEDDLLTSDTDINEKR